MATRRIDPSSSRRPERAQATPSTAELDDGDRDAIGLPGVRPDAGTGRPSRVIAELASGRGPERPTVQPGSVARPRLTAKLDEGLGLPATLISAPPGYGKSVLVAQWLATCQVPSAWIVLGEWDRSAERFLAHLVGAIRSMQHDSMKRCAELLAGPEVLPSGPATLALLSDFAELRERVVLVVDGLEQLRDSSALDLLRPLLRHPAPSVHLVLVGRSDPFLPLGALRTSGRLMEIGTNDLRFTVEETRSSLEAGWGEDVSDETARELTGVTEGWITGIRLATDSRRANGAEPGAGEHELSPEVRRYFDYEILRVHSTPVRNFLMAAAVPRVFCAPLLTVLADETGASDRFVSMDGGALEWMQAEGLFVAVSEGSSHWYSMHRLVREHLLRRMTSEHGPNAVRRRRAWVAGWLAENGYPVQAAWDRPLADDRTPSDRPDFGSAAQNAPAPRSAYITGTAPQLTRRELETLELLGNGLYYREIAERIFVSTETVKSHLKRVYRKLNVNNRRQAVRRARSLGIIGGPDNRA